MAVESGSYEGTPQSLALRRKLAEALVRSGTDTSPVGHWTQGAARLANALVGGMFIHDADKEERARDAQFTAALSGLPGLGGAGPATTPTTPPSSPPAAGPPPAGMTRVGQDQGAPVTVNGGNAGRFAGLLADLSGAGVSIDPQQTGGFASRNIRGTNTPSQHASGNAVDINWADNPEGSNPAVAGMDDPTRQFRVLRPDVARAAAARNGLRWGGDFQGRSPDPMHFEVAPNASTPVAARSLTQYAGATPQTAPQATTAPPAEAAPTPPPAPQTPPAAQPAAPVRVPPASPQIDPQTAQYIRTLIENPATRQMGLQLYNQMIQRGGNPTEDQRNYDAYLRDEAARGNNAPQSFNDFRLSSRRASAPQTQVQIDQRLESEFAKEAGKGTAKRFNEMVEQGLTAQNLVGQISALRDLSTQVQTGLPAEAMRLLGPWAEALGVRIEGLGPAQAYQSIIDNMAPRMRVPGSGATSDFDARQFLRSLPQLGNTPEGNEIIANTLQSVAQTQIAASEIASRALAGEITSREAERQIRALPNPYEMFRQAQGRAPTRAGEDRGIGPGVRLPPLQGNQPTEGWEERPNGVRIRRID